RRELGSAGKDSGDPRLFDARASIGKLLGQSFEQLWSCEHAADVVPGLENRDRLFDDMGFIFVEHFGFAPLDQLDDPPGVQIHTEADAAPVLTQVLDREPEPSRPGWTKHQPICALWKKLFGQRLAEHFVVNAKVFKLEPALWNPGCAAGLKREHGFARQSLW